VGCAITFHRASVIAGPAFARGKKKEEERKEGGGKYSFYCTQVSFESYIKRKRGFRVVNSQPGARRVTPWGAYSLPAPKENRKTKQ